MEQPLRIFDSHAHYDSEQFDPDRDKLLSHLPGQGVVGVINMGSDLDGCRDTVALTGQYGYFWGAVGIHPECAANLPSGWLDDIRTMLNGDKIVAVGEIGLDYHWLDACPKETQHLVFRKQLELAGELNLPIVVHDREAHGDTMEYLREFRPAGVMHCYSGSAEMAREVIRLGMYIGLGGVVTFKNARHAAEVAKEIPLERLLLETDAPYMAPAPFRGKRNDSSLIRYVAERIGEIRGIPAETVCNAAIANTKELFHVNFM